MGWFPVEVVTMVSPWTLAVEVRLLPALGGVLTLVTVRPAGIRYLTVPPL